MKLSRLEIQLLLYLVNENIDQGWYSGNKKYYYARLKKIKKILEDDE